VALKAMRDLASANRSYSAFGAVAAPSGVAPSSPWVTAFAGACPGCLQLGARDFRVPSNREFHRGVVVDA
jgi:hypothetical protein